MPEASYAHHDDQLAVGLDPERCSALSDFLATVAEGQGCHGYAHPVHRPGQVGALAGPVIDREDPLYFAYTGVS